MCEWISAVILKQIVRKRACKRLIFPAGEELAWDSQEAKWDEGLGGDRISLEGYLGVIPSIPLYLVLLFILKKDVERLGVNLEYFLIFFYFLLKNVYEAKHLYSVQDYNRMYARELLAENPKWFHRDWVYQSSLEGYWSVIPRTPFSISWVPST